MYQKLIIAGNLGRDPEMRYTPSGEAVTTLNVATNEKWTTNGQQRERTTWFRVSAWGRTGEACNQYLKKGSPVLIEGRLNPDPDTGGPRIWTRGDAESPHGRGTPGASYEVTALAVKFLGSQNSGGGPAAGGRDWNDDEPGATQEQIPF